MRIHKLTVTLVATTQIAALLVIPTQALAAAGTIYLTPGSSSLQIGSSETLSLRISPGTTVDGVQATIAYNPGLLQLNNVDTSSSPFSIPLQKSIGNGSVVLSLGNLSGGVSSDSLIAAFNFTALSNSGSASVNVSGANATSSGSYTNPTTSGATVSLTAPPAAAPSPTPVSQPTKTTTKTTTTPAVTPTTTPETATPTASAAETEKLDAKTGKVTLTTAEISFTSSQAASVHVRYGLSSDTLTTSSNTMANATKGTIQLADKDQPLVPGTTYYYQAVADLVDGGQATTKITSFMTPGFTLAVTILDTHNQPLKNQVVTLHSRPQTVTTNSEGVATFTNVQPGEHHIAYTDSTGKQQSSLVYVENTAGKRTAATLDITQTAAVIFQTTAVKTTRQSYLIPAIMLSVVLTAAAEFAATKVNWRSLGKSVKHHHHPVIIHPTKS